MKYPVFRNLPVLLFAVGLLGQAWGCGDDGSGEQPAPDITSTVETSLPADIHTADASASDQLPEDQNTGPQPDSSDQTTPLPEVVLDTAEDSSSPLQEVLVDIDFGGDVAVDQKSWGWETEWGLITGTCGEISGELNDPEPSFWTNEYQFADGENFDPELLYEGARKRFDEPNAGGSSKCSEVMSLQLLHECEGAVLYKSEMDVTYVEEGKITDFVVLIADEKVGVSVTRAYLGPTVNYYSLDDAKILLEKKLDGINESSLNVSPEDKWSKQILHIWTLQPDWVSPLEQAFDELDSELKADTVVLVTVESNSAFVVEDSCE